jgi:predicted permease
VGDLRFALRALRRSPGFTTTAVLILAVGIGASTAIFSVFDALVLHPLPYRDADQLVSISEDFTRFDVTGMQLSAVELDDLRAMTSSFSHLAGIRSGEFVLTGRGSAEGVAGLQVSAAVFSMLDVTPILGRVFNAGEEENGHHRVVVISEGLWRRRFGANPAIVGSSIEINREPYDVAGVSRPMLDYLGTSWDLWVPLTFTPGEKAPASRGAKGVDVVARLKPGVTLAMAQQDLRNVTGRLSALYPRMYPAGSGFAVNAAPLASSVTGTLRGPLEYLLVAVGVLLLIACANVSNLLMTRASARRAEMSIRAAMGAGRGRLVRQLLTESTVIAAVAGCAGVAFAVLLTTAFDLYGPRDLVPVAGVGLNGWVVAFAVGVSSVASLLFGLIPALATSAGVSDALKASARGTTAGRQRARGSMVALQVAASLVLLVCAGLLLRSFVRLQQVDPGFAAGSVVTFELLLPPTPYGEPARRADFYSAFRSRLTAIPGVVAAGATDRIPFGRQGGSPLFVVGRAVDPGAPRPMLRPSRILPGYFESMGIPLVRGRRFTESDRADTGAVAIIDEATARRFFPDGADPIGQRITGVEPGLTSTIVGIAGSVKRRELASEPEMSVYHAATQRAGASMIFTVKTSTDPLGVVPAIRRELVALDPFLPLTRVVTMEQRVADSLARRRLSVQLLSFFGVTALLLAAAGLYAVLSYVVQQRRREVGIRMALGAHPRHVIALVVARQGLWPVGLGLTGGLLASVAAGRLLASGLYELSPTDPGVYVSVAGLLAVTAMGAMAIPARRAARLDPAAVLKAD